MAHKKITDLTADTSPQPTDLLHVVDDISGTPTNKKVQVQDLVKSYEKTTAEAGFTVVDYNYPPGNVLRYVINTTPGTTDCTAGLQAAIDVIYTQGGGDVIIPAGKYGITAVTKEFLTKRINVNIRGEGRSATWLQKIGGTSTPVIHFYATGTGPIDAHSIMSGFRVVGLSKGHDGIRLTRLAKLELRNIEVTDCDTGLDSLGTQVTNVYSSSLASNNVGYMSRISEAIYANVMNFSGCHITNNTTHGFDIGSAACVNLDGCFFNANGTSANTATGGMVIRDTVDDEFGHSLITLNGCWFESNLGMGLTAEASSLFLSMKDTHIISSESGNAMDIGVIKHLQLENVTAHSVGDTVISAAVRTLIIGGVIHTYTDNSITTKINHTDSAGTFTNYKASNAAGYELLDEASSTTNPTLIPNRATPTTGIGGASGDISFITDGDNVGYFEGTGNLLATETSFYLYDLDSASIKQVSVGADDSGGSGFKYLRIAN